MLSLDWKFKKHIKNEQKNPILHFVFVAGIGSFSGYNPQIEMFARFKMKSSFHKTKRII